MTKTELKKQFLILNKTRKQISKEFGLSLNQIQYLLTKYNNENIIIAGFCIYLIIKKSKEKKIIGD